MQKNIWPVLRQYKSNSLRRIAMPLGGIGTGTISLGGRGDLRDWEIMNRPAKGYTPRLHKRNGPFFALHARGADGTTFNRALEGPLDEEDYEGANGARAVNHGLPRFRHAEFAAAYPLGQVFLNDPQSPLLVTLQAFNPLIPGATADSSLPVVILRFELHNPGRHKVAAAVCGSLPNFIGQDGGKFSPGPDRNRNLWRQTSDLCGIHMLSRGLAPDCEQNGSMALVVPMPAQDMMITHRLAWRDRGWGSALLDFWDDFSADGILNPYSAPADTTAAMASLAVKLDVPARSTRAVMFMLAWHFPNRYSWTPKGKITNTARAVNRRVDWIGNHYTGVFKNAWDAAVKITPRLHDLERRTVSFVKTFSEQNLPVAVKEAALFNLTALRSQTSFRTPDGFFFGFEGCGDNAGCCSGSCTHVWNYEQALPFLFGDLACGMREIEFGYATDKKGMMSFRVHLPLKRAREFGKAAADGQMGAIMKMYRDWQLAGDDIQLRRLWPKVRKALEFCWIPGGWDADQDGVMEGCQHNTMDVEYFGPNPQMQGWYLGALRAGTLMARYLGDQQFADRCARLFENGRVWMDKELFNGEYYEHQIRIPPGRDAVAPCLMVGMGAADITRPDYQLGTGCLVDQLAGQLAAHVCGLGYLHDPAKVSTTLQSIYKYNRRVGFHAHFNCMRSYALGAENALLMAAYPGRRPANPFPYFTEAMTGFEYTAAVGMIYEGQVRRAVQCISDVRKRHDGRKRNPFNEAECGHHYARAMAAWAAIPALAGFHYAAREKRLTFGRWDGVRFWSNGYAWGECRQEHVPGGRRISLKVHGGVLKLQILRVHKLGEKTLKRMRILTSGHPFAMTVRQQKST